MSIVEWYLYSLREVDKCCSTLNCVSALLIQFHRAKVNILCHLLTTF